MVIIIKLSLNSENDLPVMKISNFPNSSNMVAKTLKLSLVALFNQSKKQGSPLIWLCFFVLIISLLGQSAEKKFGRFVLRINAGLGRWTTPSNRDVLLYPCSVRFIGGGNTVRSFGVIK